MSKSSPDVHYVSGEEIHAGDRILSGGHPATVVGVIGRAEYAPGFVAGAWSEYERGILIRDEQGTLSMHDYADGDLELIARGSEYGSA